MADLTHRQVETLLKTFMEEHGWQKTGSGKYNFRNPKAEQKYKAWGLEEAANGSIHFIPHNRGSAGVLYPDAVFIKGQPTDNDKVIVAEVKPENVEMREITRGIGQSVRFLPFRKIKPYLVIPIRWYEILALVFKELPRIGVITYDNEGKMQLAQRAEDKPNNE